MKSHLWLTIEIVCSRRRFFVEDGEYIDTYKNAVESSITVNQYAFIQHCIVPLRMER